MGFYPDAICGNSSNSCHSRIRGNPVRQNAVTDSFAMDAHVHGHDSVLLVEGGSLGEITYLTSALSRAFSRAHFT